MKPHLLLAALLVTSLASFAADPAGFKTAGFKVIEEKGEVSGISGFKPMTEELWAQVPQFPKLKTLWILGAKFLTDEKMSALAGLTDLEELYFDGAGDVTDEGMKVLGKFPKLKKLTIGHNLKITPKTLDLIATLPALESLHCGGTALQDFNAAARMKKLRLLKMHHCGTGKEPQRFQAGPALREVFISSGNPKRPWTTAMPDLAGATGLTTLTIDGGVLTAPELQQLAALKKLEALALKKVNGITAEDMAKLQATLPKTKIEFIPAI